MTTLKEKLIKIGAKVVSHGRYVAFQMAEVAIPRMFRHSAAHRRTTAAASACANMRCRWLCAQEQPIGGVRPNARGKRPNQPRCRRSGCQE